MAESAQPFMKKHALREGDVVEIGEEKGNAMKGTIIPSADKKLLALKLENGYNVGISIEKITSAKKLGAGKAVGKAKVVEIKKKPALPTASILQIGGTIASRVDYRTGAVYTTFSPEDLLTLVPELANIANIETRLISNMFSEDMRFAHYQVIAREIAKEAKKNVRGIILPHGTDTMAYTAAALAFMLEDLPIPVILVGAQRSTDRGSTDAIMNLVCAMEFVTKSDFAGVGICMHENSDDGNCVILPACKTRKLHTSRRDAFKAVNAEPIATVNFKTREIKFCGKDYARRDTSKKLKVLDKMEEKVALLKIFPNIMHGQFAFFTKEKYKGLVLEGTGLGQAPIGFPNDLCGENLKIMDEIKKLVKSSCVVVMTSQCIFGRVQMHVYSNAVDLTKAGVIPGKDMLAETAFVKLAWLLGNYPKEKAKGLIAKNLRGEISERTEMDEFRPD